MVELDTGEFRPCPSGASRRAFTEWPPEAIEAATAEVELMEKFIAADGYPGIRLRDPKDVVETVAGVLWGHITGDNK